MLNAEEGAKNEEEEHKEGEEVLESRIKQLFKELEAGITGRNELLSKIVSHKDSTREIKNMIIESKYVKTHLHKQEVNIIYI